MDQRSKTKKVKIKTCNLVTNYYNQNINMSSMTVFMHLNIVLPGMKQLRWLQCQATTFVNFRYSSQNI